jgi:taurine dioxygenase
LQARGRFRSNWSRTTVTFPLPPGRRYLSVHRIAGSLGAEIHDVDIHPSSLAENPGIVKEIREAFLEHQVIFFRDKHLSPKEYLTFASSFGKPIEYPFVKGIEGFPEIIQVLKQEHETINFGGIWHSDTSYFEEPPLGSVLMAQEVPPFGGDTLFANQYAAYDALSKGLKVTLDGLKAVNTSAKADASKTREDRIRDSGNSNSKDMLEATHPVVRTHPETKRKALYVNVAHTSHFAGWTVEESAALLNYLFAHQIKPEFTCRFVWKEGSIALWDNRCVQHNPINDYHGFRRQMLRITLAGDIPR